MSIALQPELMPSQTAVVQDRLYEFAKSAVQSYELVQLPELFGQLAEVAEAISYTDDPDYRGTAEQAYAYTNLDRLMDGAQDDPARYSMFTDVLIFCGREGVEQTRLLRGSLLRQQRAVTDFCGLFNPSVSQAEAISFEDLDGGEIPEIDDTFIGKAGRFGKLVLEMTKQVGAKLSTEALEVTPLDPAPPYGKNYSPLTEEGMALRQAAFNALHMLGLKAELPHLLGTYELSDDDCRKVLLTVKNLTRELFVDSQLGGDLDQVNHPLAERVKNTRPEELRAKLSNQDIDKRISVYGGLLRLGQKIVESNNA